MRTPISLAASLLTTLCAAQTFTTWHMADGLPTDDIRDVAVAPDGTIWLATGAGVAAFNGSTFTVHTTGTHPGLASNDAYAIEVTTDGDVWVGTDFGVSVYNGASYTTYTTANGLSDNEIKNIKQAPNGDVWLATINGATRYSASSFTAFGSPSIPFGGATHVAFGSNGDVLLSGGLGGMIVYNGSTFTAVTTAGGLLSNRLRSIAVNGAQERWVGTSDGISVMDATNAHITDHEAFFELPPPDELNPVTDVLIDLVGRVWAAVYVDYLVTEGGISVYANNDWLQFEESDGLAGPNVRRIAMDADGDIWVTTSTGITEISDISIGIEERAVAGLRLFPNPARSSMELLLDEPMNGAALEVLDAAGRKLLAGNATGLRHRFDVSMLPAGLYTVRIGARAARFMVER